jgi:hypothetical protein
VTAFRGHFQFAAAFFIPMRRESLLKGETPRRRLGIPMFLGAVD